VSQFVTDISIDLETLASCPGASIAAIGVATVNTYGDRDQLRLIVDDPGGIFEPRTVRWHKLQPPQSLGMDEEALHLHDALYELEEFLHTKGAKNEGAARIWSHATFDIPILADGYRRIATRVPWHYRNCRDLRTLYDLAGGRPEVPSAIEHDALADAIAQLEEVRICMARLGR
jgi:hypothetical protein